MAGIGAFISPGRSLDADARRGSRLADGLGYDATYVTHIAGRDSLTVLMAYAAATERIRLGTGVVPIFSPHAGDDGADRGDDRRVLGRADGARARRLAPGHGRELARAEDRQAGHPDARVRRGGAGDPARRASRRTASCFPTKFAFMGYAARPDLPIYVAALSPNMLRLAGELADGVMLWLCCPSYIRDVGDPRAPRGARARRAVARRTSTSSPRCRSRSPTTPRRRARRCART